MELENKFCYGTPSADESDSLWLATPSDSLPTGNQFEQVWMLLDRKLEKYAKSKKYPKGKAYFRGDFYGDRTLYLEVSDDLLNLDFIHQCQRWLHELVDDWRIAVPTERAARTATLVYRDKIRYGSDLGEGE